MKAILEAFLIPPSAMSDVETPELGVRQILVFVATLKNKSKAINLPLLVGPFDSVSTSVTEVRIYSPPLVTLVDVSTVPQYIGNFPVAFTTPPVDTGSKISGNWLTLVGYVVCALVISVVFKIDFQFVPSADI